MYNCNDYLHDLTGYVAEMLPPNRAIISFELHGEVQSAYLINNRFFHHGKHIPRTSILSSYLQTGHEVKFSCRPNENTSIGQHPWFVTACWRGHDCNNSRAKFLSGMTNIVGVVTDLKQRHGTLLATNSSGIEDKIYFLASKVYLFGKRVSASKLLSSQLHIDDQVYFDAIPCFPEENNYNCKWFATCVHKGKKPELPQYDSSSKMEIEPMVKDKMISNLLRTGKIDEKQTKEKNYMDNAIDEYSNNNGNRTFSYTVGSNRQRNESAFVDKEFAVKLIEMISNLDTSVNNESSSTSTNLCGREMLMNEFGELELFRDDSKVESYVQVTSNLLRTMKLVTNNPRALFVRSEGIILDIINEEYGVILGEFKRNVFQSILFHRSNVFLFKSSLAHSKLSEIFMEGDRVRFMAVEAPNEFVTGWIAAQVSIAQYPYREEDLLELNNIED